MPDVKRTALYDTHRQLDARMVPFGGWAMPVEYSGISKEHTAVRTRVGLFDVSHMGEFFVRGPAALELLQFVTTNDVAALEDGQAQYSALAYPDGTVVDDLLVYRLDPENYMLVVNASNIRKDFEWLETHNGSAALIEDEVTLKYYFRSKNQIRLEPAHPNYPSIIFKKQDPRYFKVLGVMAGLVRRS